MLIAALKASAETLGCPAANIQPGSVTDMPTLSPFIWLYFEPGATFAEQGAYDVLTGKFYVFCGANALKKSEQRLLAVELCERAFRVILDELGEACRGAAFEFDDVYDSTPVALVTIDVIYQLTEMLEAAP
jgi:hypothetical protein